MSLVSGAQHPARARRRSAHGSARSGGRQYRDGIAGGSAAASGLPAARLDLARHDDRRIPITIIQYGAEHLDLQYMYV